MGGASSQEVWRVGHVCCMLCAMHVSTGWLTPKTISTPQQHSHTTRSEWVLGSVDASAGLAIRR